METTILFAPLVGALLCGFGWKFIGEKAAMWTATGLLFLACLLSWLVFFSFDGHTQQIEIMRWIESGSLSTSWAIRLGEADISDDWIGGTSARNHRDGH